MAELWLRDNKKHTRPIDNRPDKHGWQITGGYRAAPHIFGARKEEATTLERSKRKRNEDDDDDNDDTERRKQKERKKKKRKTR